MPKLVTLSGHMITSNHPYLMEALHRSHNSWGQVASETRVALFQTGLGSSEYWDVSSASVSKHKEGRCFELHPGSIDRNWQGSHDWSWVSLWYESGMSVNRIGAAFERFRAERFMDRHSPYHNGSRGRYERSQLECLRWGLAESDRAAWGPYEQLMERVDTLDAAQLENLMDRLVTRHAKLASE